MKTTFLAFCSQITDFTEGLNALKCARSGCVTISTPDFQKLCKPLPKMISHMCTFNIGLPVLLSDMLFSLLIVTTVVHIKQLRTRTKHSKYTFATLLKHCLPQKIGFLAFLHQVIASPSDVGFVTANLPFLTNQFLHKSVSLVSRICVTDIMHTKLYKNLMVNLNFNSLMTVVSIIQKPLR